jgi:hypothetical protein
MKIYLYNLFNNGDIFFNQPVIRNLCINNPEHEFTMFCKNNSYILSDIPRLTTHSTISNFVNRVYDLFFFIDENTIGINVWIGALAAHPNITNTSLEKIECDLEEYVFAFNNLINYIKVQHNINIKLDSYDSLIFSPRIPPVRTNEFDEWYHARNDTNKLVFYYNFYPKSNQKVPVVDHDTLLKEIIREHSLMTFLLPTISDELDEFIKKNKITNVIDCSKQFNCPENITSETLSKFEKIAERCNYSVHFDIGGCLMYCNDKLHLGNNTVLHFSVTDFFYKRLIKNCPKIQSKVMFVDAKNVSEVYLKLTDILTN